MKLKPYPEYKDSGVPWLGRIPEHWQARKFRSILRPISERNRPDLPLLSVVREIGVIKRDITNMDENHNYIPDDLSNYKVVKQGQFAMNKMKAWQGSYGVSKYQGIVSPAYYVFDLSDTNPEFFHVATRSKVYVPFFAQASDGIRIGQWDLNQDRMKEIPVWIPSENEQTQIARYLDYKTARINKFIRAKKRLIELLKEKKQAIINEAVTGKIDVRTGKPYPTYKDSGVEWLGKVPEGWEVKRLKFLIKGKLKYGANSAGVPYTESLPRYIRITDFDSDGKIRTDTKLSLMIDLYKEYLLCEGDILFARSGASVGKVLHCKGLTEPSCYAGYLIKAVPNDDLVFSDFLYIYTQSIAFQKWKNYSFIKATIENIGADKYASLIVLVPSKEEQKGIIFLIENIVNKLNHYIASTIDEIKLIQEYRTRLIADVVTGKVDVRGIEVPEIREEINNFEGNAADPEELVLHEDNDEGAEI